MGPAKHQKEVSASVVVIGSINFDITSYVAEFPAPNETILANTSASNLGGKGLNQAVAAARIGANVTMVACVGGDRFGDAAREHLLSNGINVDFLATTNEAPTGMASIAVNQSGDNTIIVSTGANAKLCREDIDRATEVIASSDVVLIQAELEDSIIQYALQVAARENGTVIFNPAPARSSLTDLLKYADYVTPNETETETLTSVYPTNREDIMQAIKSLKGAGVDNVVITCGARGCIVNENEGYMVWPPYEVQAVDTTGAGDVFNGVFAGAIAEGLDANEAVDLASAAAALSVENKTANTAPILADVVDLMTAQREET